MFTAEKVLIVLNTVVFHYVGLDGQLSISFHENILTNKEVAAIRKKLLYISLTQLCRKVQKLLYDVQC